jgi:hypothetical protein
MSHPTTSDYPLAGRLGIPAASLRRWRDDGYGPAGIVTEDGEFEHYQALIPLMGKGRSGDVAVLKMARAGRPCQRLRAVLAGLTTKAGEWSATTADEVVEYALAEPMVVPLARWFERGASSLSPPGDWTDAQQPYFKETSRWGKGKRVSDLIPEEPGAAEVQLRSALLPIGQAVAGEPVEQYDTIDLTRVVDGMVRVVVGPPEVTSPDLDRVVRAADFHLFEMLFPVVKGRIEWFEHASDEDLAGAVAAGAVVIEAAEAMGLRFGGDEERWRSIRLAAFVGPPCLAALLVMVNAMGGLPRGLASKAPALDAALRKMAVMTGQSPRGVEFT